VSSDRATYLDSSAIVKLARTEAESTALRAYLRRRLPLVASALVQTEVVRAMLPFGDLAVARAELVLERIDLLRVSDRVLTAAARLAPDDLRSLDAIHLATARSLGASLARVITYDVRMSEAAGQLGLTVVAPS